MSDKEKLVELLQDGNNPVWGWFPNNATMVQLADYLIAHGVTVQEWIPASEPPKDHKEYIIMIKGAFASTTLWYRPSQNTWNAVNGKAYEVTHWMPLPPAPKGE